MADKYQKSIYNLVHLSKAKMSFDGIYIDSKKLKQDIDVLWELYNKYQELFNKHEKLEQENFDLKQKLNTEEECCAMVEKKDKKLKDIIQILNRIYGFKLQYIPYIGHPELLIPDMTCDELTKEEYELLQEEIEEL